ncbi:hypothetical protein IAT38_007898 [Cryptococcus sp. DSM 104549]
MSTTIKPSILFLTMSDYGQASCQIAVIAALNEKHGKEVDIHLGSFESLRHRAPPGATFHTVLGYSILDNLRIKRGSMQAAREAMFDTIYHAPGFWGAKAAWDRVLAVLHGETPQEYVANCRDVERLVLELQPDLVVVDNLYDFARDALQKLDQKFVRLSPNTLKDVALADQGWGILTWPGVGTGYPYPLPWYLYLFNLFCLLYPYFIMMTDKTPMKLNVARHAAGYPDNMPMFTPVEKKPTLLLCMTTPEADIPGIIPPNVICCGPIIRTSTPLQQTDPELAAWVKQRPTVFVMLGSMYTWREDAAKEMLAALRVLLDKRKDLQVLWKLMKYGEYELDGIEEAGERMRVVDWLEAEPAAVLHTGNVVCFVHHGGSNSYHEALGTGTPQIILPAWFDCYDFAARVEYLGNGVWGNKRSAPGVATDELVSAFLKVIGSSADSPAAVRIRDRAQELGRLVTRDGTREGRDVAVDVIWGELQDALGSKRSIA